MASNSFTASVIPAGSVIPPDLHEDFSTYVGADDAAKTTDYRNDPRNIYRGGEDKKINQQFIVSGAGPSGETVLDYRYPDGPDCYDYTISRSLDILGLFGQVKELWWEQVAYSTPNMSLLGGATCLALSPPRNTGGGKWMHAGVQGPNAGRFGWNFAITAGGGGNANAFYPTGASEVGTSGSYNFATDFIGKGVWRTFQYHAKVNTPKATANGLFATRYPNGNLQQLLNRNVDRDYIFKCAIAQNMNQRAGVGGTMSFYFKSYSIWLSDPGWGF